MGAAHTMGNTAQADSIADGAVQRRRVQATCRKSSGESSGGERGPIPLAKWTFHRDGIPQAVAHRGYKASFPENTMGAFRGAVGVGAHAIETDVHLSQDGVVVLSHVGASCFLSYPVVFAPSTNARSGLIRTKT